MRGWAVGRFSRRLCGIIELERNAFMGSRFGVGFLFGIIRGIHEKTKWVLRRRSRETEDISWFVGLVIWMNGWMQIRRDVWGIYVLAIPACKPRELV